MVLNKDKPQRREDQSSSAYKSQGFFEAMRRWEEERSILELEEVMWG